MDPTGVLAVAGSILQFLDFSQHLVSKTAELHKRAEGLSRDIRNLEVLLQNYPLLKSRTIGSLPLLQQFRKGEVQANVEGAERTVQLLVGHLTVLRHGYLSDSINHKPMEKICFECSNVAADMLSQVERLRVKGQKRTWKTLKAALADVWKASSLLEMQKRLALCKTQLDRQVVIALRSVAQFKELVDLPLILNREPSRLLLQREIDQFDKPQSTTRNGLIRMLQHDRIPTISVHDSPQSTYVVNEEIEVVVKPRADLTVAVNTALTSRGLKNISLNELVSHSVISQAADIYCHKLLKEELEVLESLRISIASNREDTISAPEQGTFAWVYDEPNPMDPMWDSFSEWLMHGGAFYWICGSAGSGKSTLMKHLFFDNRTMQALEIWATGTPSVLAGFFVWSSGNSLQKNEEGLLRSLLYQCLADHRELIPIVFPELAHRNGNSSDALGTWTVEDLRRALRRLASQTKVSVMLCFFIDGLEEYEGDQEDLINLLEELAHNHKIKICISSRPSEFLEDMLGDYSRLDLDDMALQDIRIYANNKFAETEDLIFLQDEEPGIIPLLSVKIATKSAGIFLWAEIVVRLLIEEVTYHKDRISDIESRLEELPPGLVDLYWHILNADQSSSDIGKSSRLLQIIQHAKKPLQMVDLAFASYQHGSSIDHPMSMEERIGLCEQIEEDLKSSCRGLVEIHPSTVRESNACNATVRFTHETISDFLFSNSTQDRFRHSCIDARDEPFGANVALMQGCLLELKHIDTSFYSFSNHQPGLVLAQMWFHTAVPIIRKFAVYAKKAESEMSSCQPALIYELDHIAQHLHGLYIHAGGRYSLSISKLHWSENMVEGKNVDSVQGHGSVLSFAAKAGLLYFVTFLLRPQLQDRPDTLAESESRNQFKRTSNAQIKYASLLLEVLANSNTDHDQREDIRQELDNARQRNPRFSMTLITRTISLKTADDAKSSFLSRRLSQRRDEADKRKRLSIVSAHSITGF